MQSNHINKPQDAMIPIFLSIIIILVPTFFFLWRSSLTLTSFFTTYKPRILPPNPFQESSESPESTSLPCRPITTTKPAPPSKPSFKDGYHVYTYSNGTSYSGQWKDGLMHGRGIFLWPDGRRFEGEWKEGKENGQGTLALPDGCLYYGGWMQGLMHGQGVLRPSVEHAEVGQSPTASAVHDMDKHGRVETPPESPTVAAAALRPVNSKQKKKSVVYLREYSKGILLKEIPMNIDHVDQERKQQIKKERKKLGARPLRPGEVIYKGHRSYDLMKQLQLGIMYSIAQAGVCSDKNMHEDRDHNITAQGNDLDKSDFTAESVQFFPPGSTGDAPSFKYKDYAPAVFEKLRSLFYIDNSDYLVSLTGGPALRELPSPGSSGCIFFLSEDDRFLIKSVRKEEMALLLSLIKKYYDHVEKNQDTLLVRFFGVHRVSPFLNRNARFLVMGNVLPTNKRLHRRYDLKGSKYKRTVGEERKKNDSTATLKDLDIDMAFELTSAAHGQLLTQLQKDVCFLESLRVMDYSLLMGVHFLRWGEAQWYPPGCDWPVALPPLPLVMDADIVGSAGDDGDGGGGGQDPDALDSFISEEWPCHDDGNENDTKGDCLDTIHCTTSMSTGDELRVRRSHDDSVGHDDCGDGDMSRTTTYRSDTTMATSSRNKPKPKRVSSLLAGHSLAQTLESMSSFEIEPRLSMRAASIVANANSMRHLARAAAAASKSNIILPAEGSGDRSTEYTIQESNETHQHHASHPRSLEKKVSRNIGWGIPATALRTHSKTGEIMREPVLLYIGLIDFLQVYNARKKLEHAWKASLHGHSVSVADPHEYATRFMSCMENIFLMEKQ